MQRAKLQKHDPFARWYRSILQKDVVHGLREAVQIEKEQRDQITYGHESQENECGVLFDAKRGHKYEQVAYDACYRDYEAVHAVDQ